MASTLPDCCCGSNSAVRKGHILPQARSEHLVMEGSKSFTLPRRTNMNASDRNPAPLGTTTHHPLHAEDAPIVAAMRAATAPQKGQFFGAKARGFYDGFKAGVLAAPDVQTERGRVGGVPGWWCRPRGAREDARLIFFHGGCYVLGTAEAYRNQASHFARLAGADTFIPDYRLAPEHPFPAAFDDAWAVYRALAAEGAGKLALVGDSAGGGLALAVLAAAARAGGSLTQPAAAAVMSPWVDLALDGKSMQSRADADALFTRDVLAAFVGEYLQGKDPRDPNASPLYGALSGLPPIRIDVGDDEILLDDSTRYAERAAAAGVGVTLAIWAGMPHVFQGAVGKLTAATEAVDAAGRFLAEQLSKRA
jgi:acetyl esterase/lipase